MFFYSFIPGNLIEPEQAIIAEEAGAVAVMALQAVPADIRASGGVARMADPAVIEAIMNAVTIPVMAKCRIGHFGEAQVLEALGVDMIDESEVLTPADEEFHVGKHKFKVPFICGAYDLGQALRRIDDERLQAAVVEVEPNRFHRVDGWAGWHRIELEEIDQLPDVPHSSHEVGVDPTCLPDLAVAKGESPHRQLPDLLEPLAEIGADRIQTIAHLLGQYPGLGLLKGRSLCRGSLFNELSDSFLKGVLLYKTFVS